jgi:uncharacterized protein (DUF4415 family)
MGPPARAMTVAELAAMPDETIDYSDIPELDADWFARAELRLPQPKEAVSIRLDRDIVAYFKADGRGYQTRINAVLRAWVDSRRGAERG